MPLFGYRKESETTTTTMMSFCLFWAATVAAIATSTLDVAALVPPTASRCLFSTTSRTTSATVCPRLYSSSLFLRLRRHRPNGESPSSSLPNSLPYGMGTNQQQQQGPYVPDGLTLAQYNEIKRREAEEAAKLDYGAFGPRFKRGQRPDGDWLLQPQLWTAGFRSNTRGDSTTSTGTSSSIWSRIGNGMQHNLAPALLAWIAINVTWSIVTSSVAVTSKTQQAQVVLSIRTVAQLFFRTVLAPQVMLVPRLMATFVLTVPAAKCLEWTSRRRMWTQRRTCTITAAAGLAVWFVAAIMLQRV